MINENNSDKLYTIPDEFLTDAEVDTTVSRDLDENDLSKAFKLADKLEVDNER